MSDSGLRTGWVERALWGIALACAASALCLKATVRAVDPQIAVSAAGMSAGRYDARALDPWGRPWRFKPEPTVERFVGDFGGETVLLHFPREYEHLSLVEDRDGVWVVPRVVEENTAWISDDYQRYSVGPNGVDERLGGDDLAPEFLASGWYQPLMWSSQTFLAAALLVAWLALVLGLPVRRQALPSETRARPDRS